MAGSGMNIGPGQFDALAKLLGLHGGPATEAARLVLVEGLTAIEAARQAGCSRTSAANAVARCRRGLELARAVVERHESMRT